MAKLEVLFLAPVPGRVLKIVQLTGMLRACMPLEAAWLVLSPAFSGGTVSSLRQALRRKRLCANSSHEQKWQHEVVTDLCSEISCSCKKCVPGINQLMKQVIEAERVHLQTQAASTCPIWQHLETKRAHKPACLLLPVRNTYSLQILSNSRDACAC